ncbi:unnamed protein product [Nesidiocoris tenuis]|uniref:Uncharacterized protein n=1 Tax=Nesidiocoris tenuis TaxID=355587 RepID=A0A6H5FX72_9HEMI|nr:unnamed protein product [Nesidiocoris tenuis]
MNPLLSLAYAVYLAYMGFPVWRAFLEYKAFLDYKESLDYRLWTGFGTFFPRQRQQNPASDRERFDGRKTTSPPSQTDFEHSAENFVPVPSSKKGLRHDTRFGDRMPEDAFPKRGFSHEAGHLAVPYEIVGTPGHLLQSGNVPPKAGRLVTLTMEAAGTSTISVAIRNRINNIRRAEAFKGSKTIKPAKRRRPRMYKGFMFYWGTLAPK